MVFLSTIKKTNICAMRSHFTGKYISGINAFCKFEFLNPIFNFFRPKNKININLLNWCLTIIFFFTFCIPVYGIVKIDFFLTNEDLAPQIQLTKTATNINNTVPDPFVFTNVGDLITYEINVENIGTFDIYDLLITDVGATSDPTYKSGDTNRDGVLDVGETWIYEATYEVTQVDLYSGSFTNTATVKGLADPNNDGAGEAPVTDSDEETVNATQEASIAIVKTATQINGDAGITQYSTAGDVITYRITLANDGNVTVYSPAVSDPQATTGPAYVSGDLDGDGILDIGETWVYEATYEITQADLDAGSFHQYSHRQRRC
jgi:hypothetical protein